MKEYKIDPELNEVLPQLSDADYKALENSLLLEGYKGAPIMVWGDIIVDGHNRYEICNKHNIPFEVKEIEFASKEEAIIWMVRQQLGRRSLSTLQRIQIVEKYKPFYKKKAKKNMSLGGKSYSLKEGLENSTTLPEKNQCQGLENSPKAISPIEKIDVRAELAKDAAVSTNTYAKGVKILESGNEELIKETISGQKSINKAFNELKKSADSDKSDADFASDSKSRDLKAELENSTTPIQEEANIEESKNTSMLAEIQKRYFEYLTAFKEDIVWLSGKEFYQEDEEVSGRIHSDLHNCLEKFKNISDIMQNMSIDELDCIIIKK